MQFFKKLIQSKKSNARLGEIRTAHGVIKTPAFVPVATKGTLKALPPNFIEDLGLQVAFVNTYHLVTHPGTEVIEKVGGIHKFAQLNIPLMSDSGGFQVFSLAREKNQISNIKNQKYISKIKNNNSQKADIHGEEQPLLVKISDDGVRFRSTFDGQLIEFTPEKSIKYQRKIGADIMMAFDECIPYGSSYEYSKQATERTHRWLLRSIGEYKKSKIKHQIYISKIKKKRFPHPASGFKIQFPASSIQRQYLYGVIQGGVFDDLRKQSAEFVVNQSVEGIAIGGVSVGETKKEMREQVAWVADYLPDDKPVHLLGVGQFDDIIDLVKYGIDTFDCVEPTRLARMGTLYNYSGVINHLRKRKFLSRVNSPSDEASEPLTRLQKRSGRLAGSNIHSRKNFVSLDENIDILKGANKKDLSPVDEACSCYVCANFTKAYLHHLFKQKEILGYTLATYHNLWVMEKFFENIRELIVQSKI